MRRVIGIMGPAGAGKDTIGNMLVEHHGFVCIKWADALKDLCAEIFGYDRERLDTDLAYKEDIDPNLVGPDGKHRTRREAMQIIGTDGFRTLDPDFWVKRTLHRVLTEPRSVVIPDVRFLNESCAIREVLGGEIWLVEKTGGPGTSHSAHRSEQEWTQIIPNETLAAEQGDIDGLRIQVDWLMLGEDASA